MAADRSNPAIIDYYFGPYRFDGRLRRLYNGAELIVLTPKAADTLVALMERAGRVVEKEELLRAVWGEVAVGDDTLAQNISTLRRVLADDANRPRFIATVPRRGYRFVSAVRAVSASTPEGSLEAPPPEALPPVAAAAAQQTSGRLLALIGIAALVTALGGFVAQRLSVEDRPRALVQFTVDEPESHRFSTSGGMLALSPDGQYMAFVAVDASGSTSLWLRPLGSTVSRQLDGAEGAANPFWSPDSRTVAFFAGRRLKALDVTSGAVRVIASLASPRSLGATWSRTGEILFTVPADGMYLVAASGGSPRRVASPPHAQCEGCVAWPHFLPDGRRFLYTVAGSDASASGIYVGEFGTARGRRLLDDVSSSAYVSPGLLSFARSGTLYVQQFDADRVRLIGDPVPLSDSVASNARTGRVLAAISDAGVMAFRKPLMTELVWVDRAGNRQSVAAPAATYLSFGIAPDGRRVAAARVDPRTGTSDVWVVDDAREIRVTDDPGWDSDPVWSEDGLYVVYSSHRAGRWRIYRRQATTVGPEELLLETDSPVTPLQVLHSTRVIYAARRATPPFDVWQLDHGKPAPLVRIGGFYPSDARLSPDERWWAYGMPEAAVAISGQALYVSATPFSSDRRALAEAGSLPRWRADGKELFYLAKDLSIVAIPIDPRRTPSDSVGHALFRASSLAPTGVSDQAYDVTPDGQRFLVKREVGSSPIHVVLNWDARLGR
jgi:DNA-binding winged helix-turn-helix (wHTH) protein/Tol biopolymer transport system component